MIEPSVPLSADRRDDHTERKVSLVTIFSDITRTPDFKGSDVKYKAD